MVSIKTEKDIAHIRQSGKILSWVLSEAKKAAKEGASLSHLDRFVHDMIAQKGARPSFLNYQPEGAKEPYPASICASIGKVVVHGIPKNIKLKNGDILKIDIGVDYKGYFTDSALTVIVGGESTVSPSILRLIKATEEALNAGIDACVVGNRLGDIGHAISSIAKKYKVSVVEGLAGHGVGFSPHEDPLVYNEGSPGKGMILKEGMVLALEPMFCLGRPEIITREDGSYETADSSIAAHFEHTVAITSEGPKILTA